MELNSRTKADVLYKEALGDIDQLVSRLEDVQKNVTAAAKVVASAASASGGVQQTTKERQQTTWTKRWAKVGAIAALAAVSAAVGAGTARLMPMQYNGQASDLALASAVKSQLAQEGGNGVLWRSLRPDAQNAAIAAMGH